MPITQKQPSKSIQDIRQYDVPKLHKGKEWYVGFNAYDPMLGKMRRKKIKVNNIPKSERNKYCTDLIKRLLGKLQRGWNPWIDKEVSKAYTTWMEVYSDYNKFIERMYDDGQYRTETYNSYKSYIRNIKKWNDEQIAPMQYIYQFDADVINDFLDHIYIDRKNTLRTQNNYLSFIKTFCAWLVRKRYLKDDPSASITKVSKRLIKKQRTVIEEDDMLKLHDYLLEKNRHYLLACYVLHYCFVRPHEMSLIRIRDFNVMKQTLFISGENSKNRKDGVITVPKKVIELMLDLRVFDCPGNYYLFSNGCMPGAEYRSEKQFRDFWNHHVRKPLKFPERYKFYSLKDTGITNMLRKYDTITVRDQARHSDILMTDIYTPHDLQEANELIKNHDGVF